MCRQETGLLRLQTRLENLPKRDDYAFSTALSTTHDINHLGSLIEGFAGTVPADKGFLDAYQQELWYETQQTQVLRRIAGIWKVLSNKLNWSEKPSIGAN